MSARLQMELANTILGAGEDNLTRVNTFNVDRDSDRMARIDFANRAGPLVQIYDEQLRAVDVLHTISTDPRTLYGANYQEP